MPKRMSRPTNDVPRAAARTTVPSGAAILTSYYGRHDPQVEFGDDFTFDRPTERTTPRRRNERLRTAGVVGADGVVGRHIQRLRIRRGVED